MKETHGLSSHPLYKTWNNVTQRVKSNDYYKDVNLYEPWYNFINFYEWSISNGWMKGLTIDRINNKGDYSPDNCRWITHKKQMNNTSKNVVFNYKGEKKNIQQLCTKYNINRNTFNKRLRLGWDIEKIIETPLIIVRQKIEMYNDKMELLNTFRSVNYACKKLNLSRHMLLKLCSENIIYNGFYLFNESDKVKIKDYQNELNNN